MTKSDLQQIRTVVREEMSVESRTTREDLEAQIRLVRMEVSNRVDEGTDQLKNFRIQTERIEKTINDMQKLQKKMSADISKIKKDVSVTIISTNRDDTRLQKRVGRIESHLNLPQPA